MGILKDIGGRIGYGIAGILLTITGAILIYFEFKSHLRYTNSGSWMSYPFVILVLGLACIGVAFSKNKKTDPLIQNKKPDLPVS